MTMQQTFDKVVAHLRKQGCKAADENGDCLYRGPNGTKCAAGCLIPDDKYHPDMEGLTAVTSLVGNIIEDEDHDLDLVRFLQRIHDKAPVTEWETGLQQIANQCQLTYRKPDEHDHNNATNV